MSGMVVQIPIPLGKFPIVAVLEAMTAAAAAQAGLSVEEESAALNREEQTGKTWIPISWAGTRAHGDAQSAERRRTRLADPQSEKPAGDINHHDNQPCLRQQQHQPNNNNSSRNVMSKQELHQFEQLEQQQATDIAQKQ